MSGRFDARVYERQLLERLRRQRRVRESREVQVSYAVAYVAGVLAVVAESQTGARRAAIEAAAARALVRFHAEVWARPGPVRPVEELAGSVVRRREALF